MRRMERGRWREICSLQGADVGKVSRREGGGEKAARRDMET